MSLDRILCLANSYKHDHRCVAGISMLTKRWVRLVGTRVSGCVAVDETRYADGKEAAILDVFEAEIGKNCGSNSHPEDVFVTGKPWRLLRRFDEPRDLRALTIYISKSPTVLQGYSDRVYVRKTEATPVEKSLELICPDDLWWWIREENGKRKNRALFRMGRVGRMRYDLAVTDPRWLEKLNLLPGGIYPHSFFFKSKPPMTFLTVSLSEPFQRFHYKLIAGVVTLPS